MKKILIIPNFRNFENAIRTWSYICQ